MVINMCDFCNLDNFTTSFGGWDEKNDKYDLEMTVSIGNYSSLDMGYDKQYRKFMLVANGDGRTVVYIDYCPFCGRDLRNEREKGNKNDKGKYYRSNSVTKYGR